MTSPCSPNLNIPLGTESDMRPLYEAKIAARKAFDAFAVTRGTDCDVAWHIEHDRLWRVYSDAMVAIERKRFELTGDAA